VTIPPITAGEKPFVVPVFALLFVLSDSNPPFPRIAPTDVLALALGEPDGESDIEGDAEGDWLIEPVGVIGGVIDGVGVDVSDEDTVVEDVGESEIDAVIDTVGVTDTEDVSDTVGVTDTEDVSDTVGVIDTEEVNDTVEVYEDEIVGDDVSDTVGVIL
jgi:hypothetical protein